MRHARVQAVWCGPEGIYEGDYANDKKNGFVSNLLVRLHSNMRQTFYEEPLPWPEALFIFFSVGYTDNDYVGFSSGF